MEKPNYEMIAECLHDYANLLGDGEIDGAGRYLPDDIDEQADLIAALSPAPVSAEPEPSGEPDTSAMRVIDPDQWEPCSPAYLAAGGDCAHAPRVWNATDKNHWHPKLGAPDLADQNARLREVARAVIDAEKSWRECMPKDWEGDPLTDAVADLSAALADQKGGAA